MNFENPELGKFSLSDKELEEAIRRQAQKEGKNPDEVVEEMEAQFEMATARLREHQVQRLKKAIKIALENEEAPSIEELKEEFEE